MPGLRSVRPAVNLPTCAAETGGAGGLNIAETFPGSRASRDPSITAYRPSAKPRRRFAPSSADWRQHWPALHPECRWCTTR
ncbi:hypothetical protein D3X40_12455 [Klebsiella quasipneumoniae]|nr:hypothetical protein D3X40_21755 [Klebsiella quasipneumoniae]RIY10099.1 hypothetical protein D3X40_12455 [Klebsiella quasipneumoniae]